MECNNPHPNPLPSKGRGNKAESTQPIFVDSGRRPSPLRASGQALTLSLPKGEGRRPSSPQGISLTRGADPHPVPSPFAREREQGLVWSTDLLVRGNNHP